MNRYVASPDAAYAAVQDGTVVLNMRTKRYYSLNESGALVWALLEDHAAEQVIAERLTEMYDVEAPVVSEAVAKLLSELVDEKLVQVL